MADRFIDGVDTDPIIGILEEEPFVVVGFVQFGCWFNWNWSESLITDWLTWRAFQGLSTSVWFEDIQFFNSDVYVSGNEWSFRNHLPNSFESSHGVLQKELLLYHCPGNHQ